MRLANVSNLLYMQEQDGPDGDSMTMPVSQFQLKYTTIRPSGLNLYIGIDTATVNAWRNSGTTLEPDARQALESVMSTFAPGRTRLIVDISLEPVEQENPYHIVNANLDFVRKLADEISGYQARAVGSGYSLQAVIRYASEMNDPATTSQPYGRPVDAQGNGLPWQAHAQTFKDSFSQVSRAVRAVNPTIDFTFSPALRADIVGPRYQMIASYQPDPSTFQRVSCTWYVGHAADTNQAVGVMRQYFATYVGQSKPFGIDEMGGNDERTTQAPGQQPVTVDGNNDAVLEQMFEAMEELAASGISFNNVTLFLVGKWGIGATLAFLNYP